MEQMPKLIYIKTFIYIGKTFFFIFYCNFELSSESQDEVQSQVQTPKIKRSKAPLDFCLLYCHLFTPPHPTPSTINFSVTSRGPTTKCYTFLETSQDPRLGSKLRCKNFAHFFATLFCNQTLCSLLRDLPPSVIPFWKPLMTPDLDPNSDAKILHIFCKKT